VETTEPAERASARGRVGLIVFGVIVAGVVAAVVWGLRSPPQIGTDHDVFNTVDALFTAVTARDEKRLGECEERLRGYREAGKLPADAADELDAIIRKARSGSWQSAAERLYSFMQAQRREGVIEHGHHEHDRKAKSSKGKAK
jgi:hypothetical protein